MKSIATGGGKVQHLMKSKFHDEEEEEEGEEVLKEEKEEEQEQEHINRKLLISRIKLSHCYISQHIVGALE